MRTLVIVLLLLAVLTGAFVAEHMIIKDFFDGLGDDVAYIKESLMKNSDISKPCENLLNHWEKHKNTLYTISNHNYFQELHSDIHMLKYYSGINDRKYVELLIDRIVEVSEEAKIDFSVTLGNIL